MLVLIVGGFLVDAVCDFVEFGGGCGGCVRWFPGGKCLAECHQLNCAPCLSWDDAVGNKVQPSLFDGGEAGLQPQMFDDGGPPNFKVGRIPILISHGG